MRPASAIELDRASNGQLEAKSSELALHLLMAVFRGKNSAISFTLLQVDVSQNLLC